LLGKKARFAAAVTVGFAALCLPQFSSGDTAPLDYRSSANGSQGKGSTFTSYLACGVSPQAPRATRCPHRGKLAAFFRSPVATTYSLCVTFPDGRRLCSRGQAAEANTLHINQIFGHLKGWYKAVWTAGGQSSVKHLKRT